MKKLPLVLLVLTLVLLPSPPAEAQKLSTVHKVGFLGASGNPAGGLNYSGGTSGRSVMERVTTSLLSTGLARVDRGWSSWRRNSSEKRLT